MAIKKIKAKSPDPYLSKTKGDNTLARIAHVNQLVDQINSTNLIGPAGPQGVQGPIGPQGVPGPVGPAGLNWQGAWASGTSYVADDAVGYGGASYFCILATSGTTTPDLDTTHWALLASQGAIGATGATGAQGPTGPQGPAGTVPFSFEVLNVTGTAPVNANLITKTYTNAADGGGSYVKLPASPAIGDTYYISNVNASLNLQIDGNGSNIFSAGSFSNGSPFVAGTETNKIYVFQCIIPGFWVTWSLSSSRGYKVYSAILNGTTPTVTVLENTLGFNLNWTNPSNGVFRATAASGSPFTANKTMLIASSYNNAGTPYLITGSLSNLFPTTQFNINIFLHDGTQTVTPNVSNMFIEIRVYN